MFVYIGGTDVYKKSICICLVIMYLIILILQGINIALSLQNINLPTLIVYITGLKLYNKLSSEQMTECKFGVFKAKIKKDLINKNYYSVDEFLNEKCDFNM
jgi:hypothetical protein